MRRYNIQEAKEIVKVVCNRCGKEIVVNNGMPEEDVLAVEKRWGYFSEKDNEVHTFDLCEKCYDEITASFSIPVEIE